MATDEELFEQRVTLAFGGAADTTMSTGATIRDPNMAAKRDAQLEADDEAQASDLAIGKLIGEGGMGCVYVARQHSLARDVAVKMLKENASKKASVGLLREARLTGSLEHPGVIPVHSLAIDHRGPVLVMKRVEGVDWTTLLDEPAHPLWAILTTNADRLGANLAILTQVCRTVEFAHSRGVIHRDIKPANVMVGSYGEVYLLDWGIATTTGDERSGEGLVGTPTNMAPEMCDGRAIDERTDVYLLGATLHEVLTSTPRHHGKKVREVLHAARLSEPVAYEPWVPEHLAALCNAATAREPAKRPPNVQAFREQLAEFLQRRSAMALSDAATERLAALTALLEGVSGDAPPTDLATAYRLATEARFGFTESLREHPNSATAAAGLRSSILALVDLELRQRHADTAEALLREIEEPTASERLAARIAAVRAHDEARVREAQRLEAIDHDLDPTVAALPRALVVGFLLLLSASVSVFVTWRDDVIKPRRIGLAFGVIALLGAAAFRKRIFANAYNRKLGGLMLVVTILIASEHAFYESNEIPDYLSFASNLWLEAMAISAGAVTLQPRMWLALPPVLVGAVLAPIFPKTAPSIFAVAATLSFALLGFALWPARARKAAGG